MRIDDGVLDFRFLALVGAFAVGVPLDWYLNHPSEEHWLVVGAAFILFVMLQMWTVFEPGSKTSRISWTQFLRI